MIKLSHLSKLLNKKERANQLRAQNNKPQIGRKEIKEKEQFYEIETIEFDLNELKTYQHRIEHDTGFDERILIDEQFLIDENDDPDKVYQMLKKKQQRRIQMEEEEK